MLSWTYMLGREIPAQIADSADAGENRENDFYVKHQQQICIRIYQKGKKSTTSAPRPKPNIILKSAAI
jgi:hypothetical protein